MTIKKAITEEEARTRLAALCARGEHSQGEMDAKMRRWGLPAGVRERVGTWLADHRFTDDERFARAYVRDKLTLSHWGRRKIEQGLWAKGIDRQTQEAVLGEVPDSDYIAALRPLLRSKEESLKAATDYERRQKLVRYALSRGFTFDIIRQCIDGAEEMEEPEYLDT